VIASSLPPSVQKWQQVSFASTLYLCPILNCLLVGVPDENEAELRLGLQEALVNAAKHGNKLDPHKTIVVHFSISPSQCWWIIADQGSGFIPPDFCHIPPSPPLIPSEGCECGRGLYILHKIFDQVYWHSNGTELRLFKSLPSVDSPYLTWPN